MIGAIIFVIFFILFLAITIVVPTLPMGDMIQQTLKIPKVDYSVLGIPGWVLINALLNGVIYGFIIWLIYSVAALATNRGKKTQKAEPEDIKNILGPNEKVELYIQEKVYHPQINIDSIIVTNERIVLRHPHALRLKKDYTDYSYRDITNVMLDKGIMRSTIKLTLKHREEHQGEHTEEEHLKLDDLPNSLAEKGYGIIRENIGKFQSPFSTGYSDTSPFKKGDTKTGAP